MNTTYTTKKQKGPFESALIPILTWPQAILWWCGENELSLSNSYIVLTKVGSIAVRTIFSLGQIASKVSFIFGKINPERRIADRINFQTNAKS
jgi:hypothetical protein